MGLSEELWLEEAGTYMDTEYWCPELQYIEYWEPEDWINFRFQELVFEEWEIKQMEQYVGGLGNKNLPMERIDVSGLMKAIQKASDKIFSVTNVPSGNYQLMENYSAGGIEYTKIDV